MVIGYTTGTFDLLHEGHLRFLAFMKSRCDVVVVGLTTDELGRQQKRQPQLTWAHRRLLLENLKTVDLVVAHNGEPKEVAHNRIKFNLLFIGTDYEHDPAYTTFTLCPVIFVPCTPGVRTSQLIHQPTAELLALGVGGPVWRFGSRVIKMIAIGQKEQGNTADNYGLSIPRPRNWKIPGRIHDQPNISGVNPNRELAMVDLLADRAWYAGHAVNFHPGHWGAGGSLLEERARPAQMAVFTSDFVGPTALSLWSNWSLDRRQWLVDEVRHITRELARLRVVHADVHLGNVCVKCQQVFLIDFGWCTFDEFEMSDEERTLHERRLANDYDFQSFETSVQWQFP